MYATQKTPCRLCYSLNRYLSGVSNSGTRDSLTKISARERYMVFAKTYVIRVSTGSDVVSISSQLPNHVNN